MRREKRCGRFAEAEQLWISQASGDELGVITKKNYNFNDNRWYIREKRPEYVLIALKFQPVMNVPRIPGYRLLTGFPGQMFWKDWTFENDSYVLLRRDDVFPHDSTGRAVAEDPHALTRPTLQ